MAELIYELKATVQFLIGLDSYTTEIRKSNFVAVNDDDAKKLVDAYCKGAPRGVSVACKSLKRIGRQYLIAPSHKEVRFAGVRYAPGEISIVKVFDEIGCVHIVHQGGSDCFAIWQITGMAINREDEMTEYENAVKELLSSLGVKRQ